ncbi:MAG: proprotein convertase P-domain-containing protein [Labilithrix sp.]|nr:proprotein convertase P-domain-containing protein [Labilithrix sp.]
MRSRFDSIGSSQFTVARSALAVAIAAVALFAPARASAQSYDCAQSPLATNCNALVPDNQTVTSSLTVLPGACDPQATIVATGVRVKLSHQWVGDLTLSLIHPDGTAVMLLMRPGIATGNPHGCAGEDVDAHFSDGATTLGTGQCNEKFPAISGSLLPINPLSSLNGKFRNGTWSLRVVDGAGFGLGAIESWALDLPCTLPLVTASASQPTAVVGGQRGQFTFARAGEPVGALAVKYTVSGTAPASAFAPLDGLVTIPDGAASVTVDVVPTKDAPGGSTVVATVAPSVVYAVGSPSTGTVTIAANACGNGKVDPGEQCDEGGDNGTAGGKCAKDCTLAKVNENDGGTSGSSGPAADSSCGCKVRGGNESAGVFGLVLGVVGFVGLIMRRRRSEKTMTKGFWTKLFALPFGAGALLAASPAEAAIGTLDNVPAATLLYPYFEVDTGAGKNDTIITVQNSNASAALTNITIWSEMGVPVHHFHVYLTGYDVQSISLRDLFVNGRVPRTATAGQDPTDAISPKGTRSQDINYASCTGVLPTANLTTGAIAGLKAALTGKSSTTLGNKCAGPDHGDTIARGYVTIDTVNNCTARVPSMAGYFGAGGTGDATNQNYLLGDFFFIDAATSHVQAQPAVHIEASESDARTSTAGRYTFYGRYVGWDAADNREPLSTEWEIPFTTQETDVIVWRDSRVSQEAFTCGTQPSTYPLGSEGLMAFDMQEGVTELTATQPFKTDLTRARVGGSAIPVTSKNGALVFSSNMAPSAGGAPSDPAAAQSYAMAIHYPGSRSGKLTKFGTNLTAIALDSATRAQHTMPPSEWWFDGNTLHPAKSLAIGVSDVSPAATLLSPHFEVDTVDPSGVNTQIRLVNLFASSLLVHVTLWTDYGIPTHRFNVYLTGYDSSVVDLRWLFQKGIVDLTASAGQDPARTISPQGPYSQHINFASCHGQLPPKRLSAADIADLVSAHTGKATPVRFGGKCAGAPHGDAIARGYVTFDTVNNCTLRVPGDPGYFAHGGGGDATNQNNLSGTYTILDRNQQVSVADTLVHVQASATDPATATAGNPTFYGKFVSWSASDNREPLGTAWQARFINNVAPSSLFGAFADGKTNFVVWRESPAVLSAFTCGSVPTGFPLPLREVLQFDEQEQVTALATNLGTFPLVSQRVAISHPSLAAAYASGFISADLRAPSGAQGGPPSDPSRRGSFVAATHYAKAAGYQVLLGGLQVQ